MPNDATRVYWDACVFLSYIEGNGERLPILDALLDSAREGGEIEIVTSAISIVEVAFAHQERQEGQLDPDIEAKIDALWNDREVIKLVEFYDAIGFEARKLIRSRVPTGGGLKPADAIHLATAIRIGAAEFHTYDEKLHRYDMKFGFPVNPPTTDQPRLFE